MRNRFGRGLAAAGALLPLLAAGTAALAQTPSVDTTAPPAKTSAQLPASPFIGKKTVQASGLFSVWNSKTNKATPFFAVTITVDGSNKYRIDATPLAASTKKPSFYFSDGIKQYEFNSVMSKDGVYTIKDAPKPGARPGSQLASMAGLELILTPNAEPRKGIIRTVSEEIVDGKKVVVVTDKEAGRKGTDGKTMVPYTRVILDSASGLPLSKIDGAFVDGVPSQNLRFDFAKWTFDEPVPAKTFVWEVPEGAKSGEEPTLLANGTPAPDFTAYTPNGKPVKLSDYQGKVVVLDFWATWCGPCQRSMPHLEKVYKQVKNKGVVVLAVCVWDEKDAYQKWLVAKKGVYSFPTLFDPAGRGEGNIAKAKYQVSGIPTQYVIGKDGKIAGSTIGYTEGGTFLEDTLAKLGVGVQKAVVVR